MFGDVATRLLNMMGHSGTVPGALRAEDVGAALTRLRAAVDASKQSPDPESSLQQEDGEPVVSLSNRALPLIKLLEAAVEADRDVMWSE